MEQLVLILLIAAVSLINWLIEKSGKLREQRRLEKERSEREDTPHTPSPSAPPPLSTTSPLNPQDEMRKLFETFGIPILAEEAPDHRPRQTISLPWEEKQLPAMEKSEPIAQPPNKHIAASVFHATNPWAKRFRSPAIVREAVVLREILGPPRCLAPY
jgi:hypothetical protein